MKIQILNNKRESRKLAKTRNKQKKNLMFPSKLFNKKWTKIKLKIHKIDNKIREWRLDNKNLK